MSKSPLSDALAAIQGKGDNSMNKLPLTGAKAKPAWQNIPGGPAGKGMVKKSFMPTSAISGKTRQHKQQGQSDR